jgi:phage tail sheath gpL-like
MTGNISFPEATFALSGGVVEVAVQEQKILVLGQKTSAGTGTSGALIENVQDNANAAAGITSMAAGIVRAVRAVNQDTQVDLVLIDDNGTGKATAPVTFVGTAAEAGQFNLVISSAKNFTVQIGVEAGDTATEIAAEAVVQIAKYYAKGLPVTAASALGVVTLTAENAGTEGNNIPLEVTGVVEGVTATIAKFSGGAVDPILTGIFDVIGDIRYQTIIWPWSNSLTEVKTFVDDNFNVTDGIQDGLAYTHFTGTFAQATAAAASLNSFLVVETFMIETGNGVEGIVPLELPYHLSAYAAAVEALRLTKGAAIADLLSGEVGLDATGGPALASRPLANTPLFPVQPIKTNRGWSKQEIKLLRDVGFATVANNQAGNTIVLGEQVTTRTTDNAGNPSDAFKYANYVRTASIIREYFAVNMKAKYSQSRLSDGDQVEGRPMATEEDILATCMGYYKILSGKDYVLMRSGENNRQFFKNNIVISINLQTGDVLLAMKAPLVTQLRSINAGIELSFNINE